MSCHRDLSFNISEVAHHSLPLDDPASRGRSAYLRQHHARGTFRIPDEDAQPMAASGVHSPDCGDFLALHHAVPTFRRLQCPRFLALPGLPRLNLHLCFPPMAILLGQLSEGRIMAHALPDSDRRVRHLGHRDHLPHVVPLGYAHAHSPGSYLGCSISILLARHGIGIECRQPLAEFEYIRLVETSGNGWHGAIPPK